MSVNDPVPIAIIADAHFHDLESDYDFGGTLVNGKHLTLRSWSDTRSSSRVFNESGAALEAVLTDIHDRGIRHVVLLGDYADDGQIEAIDRLCTLLERYQNALGMRFYALPGNHDIYGPWGKHQSTRFVTTPGKSVLVTSDASVAAAESAESIHTRKMYCEGTPQGLIPLSEHGYFRQAEYIHWESPFGSDDRVETRMYDICSKNKTVTRRLMDASYLVEPVAGLWLLMLDANVFVPRDGQWQEHQKKAFFDSSDAGWNAVLLHRPYLLTWIKDVCHRATIQNKRIVAFSHYPVIPALNDPHDAEVKLFGVNTNARRKPQKKVATELLKCGVKLHFGGHLHINGFSQASLDTRQLTDIATPSPAAFPAGYKVLRCSPGRFHIETIMLSPMPVNNDLQASYRAEIAVLNEAPDSALFANTYGEFCYERMKPRVVHHYLPREWPSEVASYVHSASTCDLVCWLISAEPTVEKNPPGHEESYRKELCLTRLQPGLSRYALHPDDLEACALLTLVVDWYCLRQAGHVATSFILPARLRIYEYLAEEFGDETQTEVDSRSSFFKLFLGLFGQILRQARHYSTAEGSIAIDG